VSSDELIRGARPDSESRPAIHLVHLPVTCHVNSAFLERWFVVLIMILPFSRIVSHLKSIRLRILTGVLQADTYSVATPLCQLDKKHKINLERDSLTMPALVAVARWITPIFDAFNINLLSTLAQQSSSCI
jgi:hypothetical protein